jgi:hypothetical protein
MFNKYLLLLIVCAAIHAVWAQIREYPQTHNMFKHTALSIRSTMHSVVRISASYASSSAIEANHSSSGASRLLPKQRLHRTYSRRNVKYTMCSFTSCRWWIHQIGMRQSKRC